MPLALAEDLATYLNGQVKRIKQSKENFVPLARLFEYCQQITALTANEVPVLKLAVVLPDNVVRFSDYKK
ncbi:MAG: hypothetical protein JKX67_07670 [Colwellia sp.]|nr:hypothetical protein [Colwellia sp.]